MSHELNIFIYFKDPAYFETFVKSYISNKFEKTFVDYFLLQNKTKLLEFCETQKLKKINPMEKNLLIMFLK